MSRTTFWMRDSIKLPADAAKYYQVFNDIYYRHKKPTEEDCKVLKVTMEEALELRRTGYKIENDQRNDCHNYSDRVDLSNFERVTNRKRPLGEIEE